MILNAEFNIDDTFRACFLNENKFDANFGSLQVVDNESKPTYEGEYELDTYDDADQIQNRMANSSNNILSSVVSQPQVLAMVTESIMRQIT